jgi:hypothetical protein
LTDCSIAQESAGCTPMMRDQAAAANRDEYRIHLAARLTRELHRDGALPRDDIGIVERMHEHHVALAHDAERVLIGGVVVVAMQHDFAAVIHHGLHLDTRRGLRHHDDSGYAATFRGQRDALGMIAGGCTDHAALRCGIGELGDLVVRTAQLERKHGLQVFALEADIVAEAARQQPRMIQRRFDRDVVDTRLEYALDVVAHDRTLRTGELPAQSGAQRLRRHDSRTRRVLHALRPPALLSADVLRSSAP